jgi:hypothetical protein
MLHLDFSLRAVAPANETTNAWFRFVCAQSPRLVALTAIQGLSQNEIGCARISMMARSRSAPFKVIVVRRE